MKDIKPREKLIKYGSQSLYDYELIAILIQTGNKEKNVLELSKDVISLLTNITYIKNIPIEELITIKGISYAKATTILAAVELGRRIRTNIDKKLSLLDSNDVYDLLREDFEHQEQEHLIVMSINVKGELLKQETLYIGTTTSIQTSIKEIFKSAVRLSAYGIVIAHNHPSGDATPSRQDNALTTKIQNAGELLNIHLIEHIIIGKHQFYSYNHQRIFKV